MSATIRREYGWAIRSALYDYKLAFTHGDAQSRPYATLRTARRAALRARRLWLMDWRAFNAPEVWREERAREDGGFILSTVVRTVDGVTYMQRIIVTGDVHTCQHCGRAIYHVHGAWIDPRATGDDRIWRETCDSHDTFTAEHEPEA